MNERIRRLAATGAVIGGLVASIAGVMYLTGVPAGSTGPAPCYVMDGSSGPETGTPQQNTGTLPSGDAGRFNDGSVQVCTDGTWVKVTGYGRP